MHETQPTDEPIPADGEASNQRSGSGRACGPGQRPIQRWRSAAGPRTQKGRTAPNGRLARATAVCLAIVQTWLLTPVSTAL